MPSGILRKIALRHLPEMGERLPEVEQALVHVTAEWLRDPGTRVSLLADGTPAPGWPDGDGVPLVYYGLFLLFRDWLPAGWTFATYDTVDSHPSGSPACRAGSPARARQAPGPRRGRAALRRARPRARRPAGRPPPGPRPRGPAPVLAGLLPKGAALPWDLRRERLAEALADGGRRRPWRNAPPSRPPGAAGGQDADADRRWTGDHKPDPDADADRPWTGDHKPDPDADQEADRLQVRAHAPDQERGQDHRWRENRTAPAPGTARHPDRDQDRRRDTGPAPDPAGAGRGPAPFPGPGLSSGRCPNSRRPVRRRPARGRPPAPHRIRIPCTAWPRRGRTPARPRPTRRCTRRCAPTASRESPPCSGRPPRTNSCTSSGSRTSAWRPCSCCWTSSPNGSASSGSAPPRGVPCARRSCATTCTSSRRTAVGRAPRPSRSISSPGRPSCSPWWWHPGYATRTTWTTCCGWRHASAGSRCWRAGCASACSPSRPTRSPICRPPSGSRC
ncbi:hypothetical protein ACFQ60_24855 [Streptomyces zhihengii]